MTIVSTLLTTIIVAIIVTAVIVKLLSWLYLKSSAETAFVRTGFGGKKIVHSGGAFVIPVLHQTAAVNMNTLRIEISCVNEQSLKTRDRIRVNVHSVFYVHVKPDGESILRAVETLGNKTMNSEALRELFEGRFVDTLRSTAAELDIEELHTNRNQFAKTVGERVSDDLFINGVELENVSLLSLEQSGLEYFDPQNAFDAEGLTKLTRDINEAKRLRDAVERDTEIAMRRKALDVEHKQLTLEKEQLDISRENEYARMQQQNAIAIQQAQLDAEVTREQAERQREAEEAKIVSRQLIEQKQIAAKRDVESASNDADLAVAEIRINTQREIKEKELAQYEAVQLAEIKHKLNVELSVHDKDIALADKSKAKSQSLIEADELRSKAVRSEEAVNLAREMARAESRRDVQSIEAERQRVAAEGELDVEKIRLQATQQRYSVDAEGKRAQFLAENEQSVEQIEMKVKLASLEKLPDIIRESSRPMEQIDDIKIIQIEGLQAGAVSQNGSGADAGEEQPMNGNFAEQVMDSALRYRTQAPLVDSVLSNVGLDGKSLDGITQSIRQTITKEDGETKPSLVSSKKVDK